MIMSGRQLGKTYAVMTEIQAHIVAGIPPSEILVVLPQTRQIHYWTRAWEARFGPSIRIPVIASFSSAIPRAGNRMFRKMYIEDVDLYDDGIYERNLENIFYSLRSPFGDEEVVFTSSLLAVNQRTHSVMSDAAGILRKLHAERSSEPYQWPQLT